MNLPSGSPNGGTPPSVGAVDLGALKVNRQHAEQVKQQLFAQNGLICPCGERITDEGVTLFSFGEGIVPTPQGPQPGAMVGSLSFHSRSCPVLEHALSSERPEGEPKPIAIRPLPPVEWLD
jgi:hypothetical protein